MIHYFKHAMFASLIIVTLIGSLYIEAFKQTNNVLSSVIRRRELIMAMKPLSKPLVPHAAPTDTPSSLKDMTDRALEGLGRKKVVDKYVYVSSNPCTAPLIFSSFT